MNTSAAYRPRILLVDDDLDLLALFEEYLTEEGYEVLACVSGEVALVSFKRDVTYFDILLTDYQMPGMSGAELCRQIVLLRDDMPFIVISGNIDKVRKNLEMGKGVVRMLAKPIRLASLTTELTQALSASLDK